MNHTNNVPFKTKTLKNFYLPAVKLKNDYLCIPTDLSPIMKVIFK